MTKIQYKFYNISLVGKALIYIDQVEEKFNTAPDWIKYGNRGYIVKSNRSMDKWEEILEGVIDEGDFLIFEIDVDRLSGSPKLFSKIFKWFSEQ